MSPDGGERPPVPLPVRLAGWVWVGHGVGFGVLLFAGLMFGAIANQGAGFSGTCCGLFTMVYALLTALGAGAVRGTLAELWSAAALSLVMAAAHLVAAGLLVWAGVTGDGIDWRSLILFGFAGPPGVFLLAAGVLAIRSQSAYAEWRREWGDGQTG